MERVLKEMEEAKLLRADHAAAFLLLYPSVTR